MVKTISLIFGVILALLGLLGFVSNPLIGVNAIFATDAVHNGIYLLVGLALLGAGRWASPRATSLWLKSIGIFIFLLGFISTNTNAGWLNIALGFGIFSASYWRTDSVPVNARVS